jgi:4-cresol dehydrogenase (hydroxylating)
MAAPPGVSERVFSRALEEFRNVVGSEWVFASDEDVNLYRDAYSPFYVGGRIA